MWTDKGDIKGPFQKYHSTLTKYGCSDENIIKLQSMWNEPHRVYHNQEHLDEIISLIEHWKTTHLNLTPDEFDSLLLTAFFHDAVYDPISKTNEEDSAKLYLSMCQFRYEHFKDLHLVVEKMILDTKDHTKKPSSHLSEQFLVFDLHGLVYGSLSRKIADEAKIMREFGFVDFETYKNERGIKFLDKYATHIRTNINPQSNVMEYVDWFKNRTPKIAIYPGSFFEFHRGHLDILKRAERIFDKVIILMCVNPGKRNNTDHMKGHLQELLKKLPNNQIEFHDGMLHEYIKKLKYPVSIVKGLRNASDFDSEKLQLRYMEDLCPDINIVYIVSDRKYEHVSSSGIKQIQSMGAITEAKEYLI
jgi:pantetheine-phosphate adenylyltransferase